MSTSARNERIVGVAIRRRDGSVCELAAPSRHHHVIRRLADEGEPIPVRGEQGFVTDAGRFVDRTEAGRLADANGQAHRTDGSRPGGPLFSEDLW